jgi:ribosome biogenesis ATPase
MKYSPVEFEVRKFYDSNSVMNETEFLETLLLKKPALKRQKRKVIEKIVSELYAEKMESESDSQVQESQDVQEEDCKENLLNSSLQNLYARQNAAEKSASSAQKRKSSVKIEQSKKAKVVSREDYPTPLTRLSDLGGVDEIAQELLQLVGMPLMHPEIFTHLGIEPPRGILLQGSPGTYFTKGRNWKNFTC